MAQIIEFLLSPKRKLILLIVVSFIMAIVIFFILWPLSFSVWNLSRTLVVSVAIGVVLAIPPRDVVRTMQKYLYIIGYATWTVTLLVVYYGRTYEGPGDDKFYEVCALTLPILLLAVVIDIHLFERPAAHPGLIFLNLFILVGGEGAALLALSAKHGSRGVFAWVAASMTGMFALIIASAIAKQGAQKDDTQSTLYKPISPLADNSISLLKAIWLSKDAKHPQSDEQRPAPVIPDSGQKHADNYHSRPPGDDQTNT